MSDEEIEGYQKAEEDLDPMEGTEEDNDDLEIMGYFCLACNHSQSRKPSWGGQCPKCGNQMDEEYF